VFLPPLDPGRVYKITIQGTCTYLEYNGLFSKGLRGHADALYRTNKLGDFRERHDFLKLDDIPIRHFLNGVPPETMAEVDRNAHQYSFRIDGAATRISATLHVAFKDLQDEPSGPLAFTIWLLPEGTPSPAAGKRREETEREKAQEAERVARENAKRAEQAAIKTAALRVKLESLRLQAHCESHFLTPEFQQDFAKHDPTEILKTKSPEWRKQYAEFMQDASLKSLAEEQAPEVIQWFEARVKIAQLAERALVANFPKPKEMTAEEMREEMLRRKGMQIDDMIAGAKLKGKKLAEADASLDELELDPDKKEELKTEVTQFIMEEGMEEENGKESETL
jgi:hypothetical protein